MLQLRPYILFLAMGFAAQACFNTPKLSSGRVTVLDASAREVVATQLSESKSTATMDPASKTPQRLMAASTGALSGSSVTMRPGSLSIAAELVVEQASDFSQTSLFSEVGLDSETAVQGVSSGMIIRPTEGVSLSQPLTINMPIPISSGLRLASSTQNLAIFYKQYVGSTLLSGVIPSSLITVEADGTCSFEGYFGAYWVALMSKPVVEALSVKSEEPIVNSQNVSVIASTGVISESTIVAKASIPEITWSAVAIALNAANRSVGLSGKIGAEASLVSCKVDLYTSVTATSGLMGEASIEPRAVVQIVKTEAHTLYGRFRCLDNEGRSSLSPWSTALDIPALVTTVPALTAFNGANEAQDGLVNLNESSSTLPLLNLVGVNYQQSSFTSALSNSPTAVVCDASKTYDQTAVPQINSLKTDGQYVVCVKLSDAAGQIIYGKSQVIVRDTVAPIFSSLAGANEASDLIIYSGESSSTLPLFTLNASGASSVLYTAMISDSPTAISCGSSQSYTNSQIPAASSIAGDGVYALCVMLSDAAGNVSFGKSPQLNRKVSGPNFISLLGAQEASDGFINDTEKNSNSAAWALNASGQASYSAVFVENGTACSSAQAYSQSVIPSISSLTADGAWVVCVKLVDVAGNIAFGKSQAILRDTVLPTFSSFQGVNAASDGIINAAEANLATPLLSLTGSDYVSAFFTGALNDTSPVTCDASKAYTSNTVPNANQLTADGTYAVCLKIVDAAGNVAFGKSPQIVRNTAQPVFSSLAMINAAADGYVNYSERMQTSALWSLNASGFTTAAYTVALDDTANLTCNSSQSYSSSSIPSASSLTNDVLYTVCVKLSNAAGNVSYGKAQTISRDTLAPLVLSLTLANQAADGIISSNEMSSNQALVSISKSETSTEAYTAALLDTSMVVACDSSLTYANSVSPLINSITSDGIYVVCARLIDTAGNINYGKSSYVNRTSVSPPMFYGLSLMGVASDGYVNDSEKLQSGSLWYLSSSGQTTADFTMPLDDTGYSVTCDASKTYNQVTIPAASSLSTDGIYAICVRLSNSSGTYIYGKSSQLIRDIQSPTLNSLSFTAEASDGYIKASESASTSAIWTISYSNALSAMYTYPLGDAGNTATCDSSQSYTEATIPAINSLTSDGYWALCVRLDDAAGNHTFGKSQTIERDTVAPNFSGIGLASVLSDGYLNKAERDGASTPLISSLGASGYISSGFIPVTAATTCNSSLSYGSTPTTQAAEISGDGVYKVCGMVTDSVGNRAYSSSGSFTVDLTPPSFVGVKELFTSSSGSETSLFWEPATDAVSPAGQLWYEVCVSSSLGQCLSSFPLYGSISGLSFNLKINSLTPGVVYEFQVVARDQAGNRDANTRVLTNSELSSVLDIAMGRAHTCALLTGGNVYCWGANEASQLGNNTVLSSARPMQVSGVSSASAISIGSDYSCALISDGSVKCWGANNYGQLGRGNTDPSVTPVTVSGISTAVALSAGPEHSCAILSDTSVQCWGRNYLGQLGDGTTVQRNAPVVVTGETSVSEVAVGSSHSCALRSDGTVSCWGSNYNGQLGFDPSSATTALSASVVSGIGNAVHIDLGEHHTCARLGDSSVKCWGSNDSGQLGDGSQVDSFAPVTVSGFSSANLIALGANHSCSLRSDGALFCWGSNYFGQKGEGTRNFSMSALNVPGVAAATAVAARENSTCIVAAGKVKCWGENGSGQAGIGTSTVESMPIDVPGLPAVTQLALGGKHSCALVSGGNVWCWGDSNSGQLGDEVKLAPLQNLVQVHTTYAVPAPLGNVNAIAAGSEHSCALLSGGSVVCWGDNSYGQLGDNTIVTKAYPITVTGITNATGLALGFNFSCALLGDTTVKCWGDNLQGQLGDGSMVPSPQPVQVASLSGVVSLAAGLGDSVCALMSGGNVKCWGRGLEGQLGNGSSVDSNTPVDVSGISQAVSLSVGTKHACARLSDNTLQCWGSNSQGQLGDGTNSSRNYPGAVATITDATSISLGKAHSCARLVGGKVACWGSNQYSNLANGMQTDSTSPVLVSGLSTATTVQGGFDNSCAILADYTVRCWGLAEFGQNGPAKLSLFRPELTVVGP